MPRKIIICKKCGEEKENGGKGLCSNCYQKQNLRICKECGELKPYASKGLCGKCYQKQKPLKICKNCKKEKIMHAFGLCQNCYEKEKPLKICSSCNKLKPHHAKGLCDSCYRKQNLIVCKKCGKEKPHQAFGLCALCYNHLTGKSRPMSENKSCSNYLGIVVAEELLSKVFKDVTQMPPNNKGYDFICSKGMKIDVKSSTLHFDKRKPNYKGRWAFIINKNKIADYFLIIAFDSRSSLTPQHLWLIPAEKISYLQKLSISKLQIQKWTQYEFPLEKTLEYCESMKI